MMDIQESEEDMEKVECEWGSLPMTPSPAPSFMSIKSGQSMDRPIAFNRGAQSNIGEKVRLDETPSPALSHLSMTSDQSMDRPIAFNNGKQNYMDERVRSNETPSLVPLHLSMTSHQTMDCPIAFNNEKQRYMGENVRLAEAPSPAPSHLSVKSYQSMDRPIAFRNGTLDYGLRPNEAPSPSASYFSLKSNQSMDRPIAFKDNTHPYNAKRLRQEETPSPAPSFQSMKSHQSMDRPIAFNSGTSSYTGLRPDEAPSPATSYLSLQSNQSMDRPIAFKDRTQTYGAKKVLHVAPSPAPSLMSVKSDQSMDRPIAFSSRARNYMTENLNEPYEATSPAPSLTSLKSEQSMDRPITFRNEAHSHEFRSTLSAVLLTDDHYRCSVCTEVFKDPVSIPCGHSYCKHCIEIYWSKPAQPQGYACPQCRKRFRDRPVLNVNLSLTKVIEELLKAGFSPAIPVQCYAGPEDVPCDICTEMKLKAVKSCLTCTASFCETHIRQHYTVPALHRHNLVEAIIFPNKEEEKSQDEIRDLVTRVTELEATSKRLCKRFEIHCNGFSDFPPDVIEMAALGRPLKLGMLYDNKTNSFCQDTFKWDEDMLACLKVSLPRPQTHVKVLENDSPHERFRVLEMSPVLQVGTQTGQIKINGSASFLNHPEQSQYQERATLHYRTTTRLDMISQRHLQESAPSAVFGQTTASHVIIAVYYGAQAFFVFDSSGSNHDKNTEIADVLKTLTSTFCSNHIISSLNAAEKAKSSSFSCSLYIDVGDWKSPVSFDKAVDIYGSLPMLLGSKGEKAIPLKVWLYPLEKLVKSPVHAALSEVSENLKHQVENVLEHLRKQIMICQDMITDFANVKVIQWFPTLEDKLLQFTELLQEYQTTFQKRITETVHIKEGKTERSSQELLERYQQSPFSAEKTNQWLENKETELRILNDCRAADITVVKSQAELQQIISDPQITRVMCLTLFSPNSEDSFLTALKNYSKFDQILRNDSLMFRPINIDQKALIKVQLFIAANEDEEQTKFIATSITGDDFPEYSVQFYHYGRIESRNVTFGTKPDFAQPILVKHTSLSLKLKQPHKNSIESYMVEHRDLADDGRNSTWKRIKFDATGFRETCLISDLNPGHQYQLRYIFVEQDCMTFSRITNFQTAVAETPGQPFVDRLSRDSLRVMWQKAEADCPVLHYLVEYKEAGLEGWSSVLTQGPECEYILTLPHSTCYRIRVSAVYEEITSKPSEETSVPVNVWYINLSERKSYILLEVLKLQTEKKPVELIDWTDEESEVRGFLQCLPYISQLRFNVCLLTEEEQKTAFQFLVKLSVAASEYEATGESFTFHLISACSYSTFPFDNIAYVECQCDFLLDLYSHLKDYESQTGRRVLPALQPVYQSAPAVWRIKLSERKSSILLEVLKLQTENKPVQLIDWTDEESEVRGFLQCLPYISQLRLPFSQNEYLKVTDWRLRLTVLDMCLRVPALKKEVTKTSLETLYSYITYGNCNFLLDLYIQIKAYANQTGRDVFPALKVIYQSAPAVWSINLSKIKSSILLEVLKFQTENKQVELTDWTDEESEVRGFLQCVPYISQLRFGLQQNGLVKPWEKRKRLFIMNLCLQAALDPKKTVNTVLLKLSSVSYERSDFLLDLYSHLKNYESQSGRIVLPALQSLYQSAPAVWRIKLSERKSSILLEVLKLQTEKKPVELIDWTDEESELRGFLQCLPDISQLRFAEPQNNTAESWDKRKRSFILKLSLQAALHQKEKIEETVNKLLSSVEYKKSVFLLDLCSYVKDYESQTGWSVLPALQPVYQSPAVWRIKLSERKSSILLEVLKLQTEKKPVELIDWTDEESELRGFLQCLPYISQLRFAEPQNNTAESWDKRKRSFILKLSLQAALHQKEKIEETVNKLLSSVEYKKSVFLLDLCSYVKDYESQTGWSVLPALQPVYQSPAVWRIKLSERKSSILLEVLKLQTEKKPVELIDWTDEESELRGFLQCLPYISQLRFAEPQNNTAESWDKRKRSFILKLSLQAALHQKEKIEETVNKLLSSVEYKKSVFLLDLCSYVKDYESQTGWSVLPALQPVYQSPAVWRIKLSERKSSILLEVLKLQTEKKPVELIDWTDEESELRGFLQCLPYISQLRFVIPRNKAGKSWEKIKRLFILDMCLQAALHQEGTIEEAVKKLLSSVNYEKSPFLLDLCSHVKNYESQTGKSVLPALQPVYQSLSTVWSIKFSIKKSSILLEVLKLQTEKKPVELIDCTDEESEVRGFLQCLPYISQLRFDGIFYKNREIVVKFLWKLFVSASEYDTDTGENCTELLTSACSYTSFPCKEFFFIYRNKQSNFLLDLWSHVKNYKSQTGRSVFPALQPVYQSAPAVWRINLSERKSSILLEVLKLQTEKKPVELIDWTDEESELRGFLQCLPYISQLRVHKFGFKGGMTKRAQFLLNLTVEASKCVTTTGENYIELLTSVCSYRSFLCLDEDDSDPEFQTDYCDFLLDQWSHVKDYESQTGRSVLPALKPVYQSAPAVWRINLSERKSSILLEVLKLQTEKKPVELIDWTDEESEVKIFLQCLPYISQLSFQSLIDDKKRRSFKFLVNLIVLASYFTTKENYKEIFTSVCSYRSFPFTENYINHYAEQSNFLLDLYSHVKDLESQTGRSVLLALQPVYQVAPAVWRIKLLERKSSILLEVLKLQTEKKPVELIDLTDEESELRRFLQCLPYISELRIPEFGFYIEMKKRAQFLLNLTVEASKCVTTTGESYIVLLTSVCSYRSFVCFDDDDYYQDFQSKHCDFLLDLCSRVKDYESQSGRSVLPALQPVYQSAPGVWRIKLSERKSSILLEVLKLQTEKKPVELIDWTDEESEVRGFLQCLSYISQLRIHEIDLDIEMEERAQFLLNLTVEASKCVTTTGESYIELLTSVCSYRSFVCLGNDDYYEEFQSEHCDFLLDLCSRVKDYESQSGRKVLPALQPVYQSAPGVWRIKLSERKSSILLEVLKLQTEKKPVELIDWTDEESEVRGFIQCLPYISQLSFISVISCWICIHV
ncbi:uncharacterized protein si:ch211-281l24.3 isoform X3 [Danio aesculapii]|uniref:uncharacterized protein si:ch211-281l24.3 isoform X3 n=1 Tax=Danio aesculapii TaxID=1142201 RepID=UPI0024BF8C9A|nr:uncharacterized protein si:ch211-281l24.3 isoform X3 [Danio aesculapii]